MKTESIQPKLDERELNVLFERYLPAEVLPQVKEAVHALFHENGQTDLWEFRDRMTGMYNTQGILQILDDWKTQCLKTKEHILLLCIDIEKMETLNRIYGHSEGDVVIQTLGQILEDSVTENEICGHLGSSEFIVIMRTSGMEKQLTTSFLHAINGRIDNYNRVSGKEYSFHVSHSMSVVIPSPETGMQDILDKTLSQKRLQKEAERSLTGSVSQKQTIDPEEHRLVNEVLDKNLFRYAFQPIIDARTGDIYAYEALMRTEEQIPFSPLVILKYATYDDRLYDVERATFFNVLDKISGFGDTGNCKFFINSISTCQLVQKDYESLRAKYGHLFPKMVVEITEQTEMEDAVLDVMIERSKQDGFGLAVDDYGTGYSNTSSLLRYLPNCVKIDRLLITEIQENPKKQHFVNNIITFAHDNGFLALAEGVETSAELKAVIQMGADLIQGFYTAKPDYSLLRELPAELKNEIINDNICLHENIQRKVFIVNDERELLLMQLALEQYNGIVIAQPELTLVGNRNFPAAMSIKIKDGCNCRLTLRDVCMESIEDMPCIDIGENANLTLVLEGSSVLTKTGIRVPDGSSCRLEGAGNLSISSSGFSCYGIGNDFESGVGSITYASSGKLEISTEANHCVCIGGGIYRQGEGIRILCGDIQLKVAGVDAIGIGCCQGAVPIDVRSCSLNIDFRVATGCAIGSLEGDPQLHMVHTSVEIAGSGGQLCGIGSAGSTAGEIHIAHASVNVSLNGQKVRLLGNEGGSLKIAVSNTSLTLNSEGSNVMGIGSFDGNAVLEAKNTTMDIHLRAAENVPIGAREENCRFEGGSRNLLIND